ncbi:MAG: cytochrome C oxidase subunit IV family protein [Salibacteraceae bacterium]
MTKLFSNTGVWISLIVLLTISTLFAEQGLDFAIYIIVTFSSIKFISISFQFMEVKNAHPAWKALVLLFVLVYLTGVLVLY